MNYPTIFLDWHNNSKLVPASSCFFFLVLRLLMKKIKFLIKCQLEPIHMGAVWFKIHTDLKFCATTKSFSSDTRFFKKSTSCFFLNVFLSCATQNILSRHECLFLCEITFFVITKPSFFESYTIIFFCNVTCETIYFVDTQYFLCNA